MRAAKLSQLLPALAIILSAALLAPGCPGDSQRDKGERNAQTRRDKDAIVFFAAMRFETPLDETVAAFEAASDFSVMVTYGDSKALLSRIERGEACDLFLPEPPIDLSPLFEDGESENPKLIPLVMERLALIIPRRGDNPPVLEGQNAAAFLKGARNIALADPDVSILGRASAEALEFYRIDTNTDGKIIKLPDERAILLYVSEAEADAGVIFASTLGARRDVTLVDYLLPESHTPVVYPLVRFTAEDRKVGSLAEFLASGKAIEIFRRHGFDKPPDEISIVTPGEDA